MLAEAGATVVAIDKTELGRDTVKAALAEFGDQHLVLDCDLADPVSVGAMLAEATERTRSGIGNLRIKFNGVFGYFIEVSKGNAARVPAEYERRQTLTNSERFTTPELREWEKKHPGRVDNIFSSLSTVVPSHLMDRDLFGFADLKATGVAMPNGDIAFDDEPCSTGATISSVIPLRSDD